MSEEARGSMAAAEPDRGTAESVALAAPETEGAPVGTLFFMMLFLLVMVGLWATVYWMLLSR